MKARALWLLFAPVLACAAAVWVHAAHERRVPRSAPAVAPPPLAATIPAPTSSAVPTRPATEPAQVKMRAQVADAAEDAIKVVDSASLETYLAALEARARKQGRVSALEIEPALAVLQQFDESGARTLAFTQKMRDLQHSLETAASGAR